MKAFGRTDVGKIRKNNEDSFFLTLESINFLENLFIVADGMGGHSAGEIASQEAIKKFIEYILERDLVGKDYGVFLKKATEHANYQTYMKSVKNIGLKGMGTTLTTLTISGDKAYCSHVGDSRLYIFRDNELKQITVDHTFIQEMVATGKLTDDEARLHPNRNMITRAVGISANVETSLFEFDIKPKDIILMCSDGLTGMVTLEEIVSMLELDDIVENKTDKLVQQALDNGGEDNVTVMLVEV